MTGDLGFPVLFVSACNVHWCKLKEILRLRKAITSTRWFRRIPFRRSNKTFCGLEKAAFPESLRARLESSSHPSEQMFISFTCLHIYFSLDFNSCLQFSALFVCDYLHCLQEKEVESWSNCARDLGVLPCHPAFSFFPPAHVKWCVYCMSSWWLY